MSKIEVTTHDLLQRLGTTSHLRSARADALFRRLRFDTQGQITDALMRAPMRVDVSALEGERDKPKGEQRKAPRKPLLRKKLITKD